MLDIRFVREHPEEVRENIRKKFQEQKLPLVDEILELDGKLRAVKTEADTLRARRNSLSKQIGMLMGQAKKDPSKAAEAEAVKAQVAEQAARLAELEAEGAVTVIRPAEPAPPKFTNDNALVRSFYAHGRSRAAEAMERIGGIGR